MKKIILSLLLLTYFTSAFSQGEKKQRLKAYKTAYITQELDLTSKEAEKFWPIYNDYEQKKHELKSSNIRNERQKIKDKGGVDALSEKEANIILNNLVENEEQIIIIKKKLFNDLKKVIPPQKILILYRTEHDFNRKLLMEYRKKQMMKMQGKNR